MRRLTPHLGRGLLLAGLTVLGAGCQRPTAVDVIAADGALCDITRRLAAKDLTVSCLLGPNDDPHQVQLSPQRGRQLRQARLVLTNGYGLTPALERWPGAVKVAELAVPNSPSLDPHVWHDPRQGAALVAAVRQRLKQLDPKAAPAMAGRAAAMERSLQALHRWNRAQVATIPGARVLATEHRGFAHGMGFLAGVVTMIANAAGPVMTVFLLSQRLEKRDHLGVFCRFFLFINLFKLPFSNSVGIITGPSLLTNLVLLPGVFLGLFLGWQILKRIPQDAFENTLALLTAFAAIWLMI